MNLFLSSEAKHPESMQKLQEFVPGGLNGKKILYIPTAGTRLPCNCSGKIRVARCSNKLNRC